MGIRSFFSRLGKSVSKLNAIPHSRYKEEFVRTDFIWDSEEAIWLQDKTCSTPDPYGQLDYTYIRRYYYHPELNSFWYLELDHNYCYGLTKVRGVEIQALIDKFGYGRSS